MSNRPAKTPLGKPVAVGKAGYQIMKEVWPNGDVRFFAEVGRPWKNDATGAEGVITKCYSGAVSDFIRATQEAEPQLEAILRATQEAEKPASPSNPPALEFVEQNAPELKLAS